MSTVGEHADEELPLHGFTVDDPGLWEFRRRLTDEESAIPGLTDEEWELFHAIIAEA